MTKVVPTSPEGGSAPSSLKKDSVYRFQNISFTVNAVKDKKPVKKKILQNISATVKSGHVLAIMGPSGAGKTTLINVSGVCLASYEGPFVHSLNPCIHIPRPRRC